MRANQARHGNDDARISETRVGDCVPRSSSARLRSFGSPLFSRCAPTMVVTGATMLAIQPGKEDRTTSMRPIPTRMSGCRYLIFSASPRAMIIGHDMGSASGCVSTESRRTIASA